MAYQNLKKIGNSQKWLGTCPSTQVFFQKWNFRNGAQKLHNTDIKHSWPYPVLIDFFTLLFFAKILFFCCILWILKKHSTFMIIDRSQLTSNQKLGKVPNKKISMFCKSYQSCLASRVLDISFLWILRTAILSLREIKHVIFLLMGDTNIDFTLLYFFILF